MWKKSSKWGVKRVPLRLENLKRQEKEPMLQVTLCLPGTARSGLIVEGVEVSMLLPDSSRGPKFRLLILQPEQQLQELGEI